MAFFFYFFGMKYAECVSRNALFMLEEFLDLP